MMIYGFSMPHELWTHLRDLYGKMTPVGIFTLLRKALRVKIPRSGDPGKNVAELASLFSQLNQAGIALTGLLMHCLVLEMPVATGRLSVMLILEKGIANVMSTSSAGPTLIPSASSAHEVLQIPPTIDDDPNGNYVNTVPANLESSYRWGWERTHSTDEHSRYTHVYLRTTPEFMLQVIRHLVYQLNHPSPSLPAPVYHHSSSSSASASPASTSDETMESEGRTWPVYRWEGILTDPLRNGNATMRRTWLSKLGAWFGITPVWRGPESTSGVAVDVVVG
ncbi:hypothetical protein NP233_g11823 [Leucocoprinus birnbaumii]|uniref:Uncharacterized protein n=1 Tax=Leucocoprinus birnbaumii TaxID=56174 RepID=A0AAD5VI95_9AGAR|nr:hypothetical protein NP233_g11823 [Leucocoprinus birnbaumii]